MPFKAFYQKSGASILISLASYDLNLVFENVLFCDIEYYTFLAFLDKIS